LSWCKPVSDGLGNFDGYLEAEGFFAHGTIYELAAPAWSESTLWTFARNQYQGVADIPTTYLTVDALGNVYGGFDNDDTAVLHPYDGYVVRVGPSGTAAYKFPALPVPQRFYPTGSLAVDAQGNVYGMTSGINYEGLGGENSVFEITF